LRHPALARTSVGSVRIRITGNVAPTFTELSVEAGQAVKTGQVICVVQSE
jgi:biotin carboxyl carrier protein